MAFLNKYEKNGHIKLKRQRKKYQLWHILKIFHFNQYNRCKTYTRCEKGSGVDQFYKKEYIRLIFAKKDYNNWKRQRKRLSLDVRPKNYNQKHNRLEKVVEQNFSSLFDKKMQNVYNIWKRQRSGSFLQKGILPIDICKDYSRQKRQRKRLSLDVLPNDYKKRHNRLENVAEQNYSSLFDKKMQNVYKMYVNIQAYMLLIEQC